MIKRHRIYQELSMRTSSRRTFSLVSLVASLLVCASVSPFTFADEADQQTEEMTVMGAMQTPLVEDADLQVSTDENIQDIPVIAE
ncbi:hypothetical protein WKI13_17750 [Teredinibacter turnerae]|uniref:hypothetical protein n=1 Tax=Teredinibacter turnerae TaxID=2426 RepID=UPI000477960E|nr:hypothetical protein [Teredinibacter turnerae]